MEEENNNNNNNNNSNNNNTEESPYRPKEEKPKEEKRKEEKPGSARCILPDLSKRKKRRSARCILPGLPNPDLPKSPPRWLGSASCILPDLPNPDLPESPPRWPGSASCILPDLPNPDLPKSPPYLSGSARCILPDLPNPDLPESPPRWPGSASCILPDLPNPDLPKSPPRWPGSARCILPGYVHRPPSSISSMADISGDGAYSVLTIASLEETVNKTKWQVRPSAGNSSCCIFRAPVSLVEVNKMTYGPQIVSIGPYHYGKPHLEMMQQHKRRYLHDFLNLKTGPELNDYRQAVASKLQDMRGCYAESTLQFCDDELVDMMVLDGLFVIEFLCKYAGIARTRIKDDPVFHLAWVFTHVIRDLLRLENQIPFFVLQTLFDASRASRRESNSFLAKLALDLFANSVETPYRKHEAEADPGKHLLDLLRLSFIAPLKLKPPDNSETTSSSPFELIQSAQKLHASGIKFKARKAKDGKAMSFLDISYNSKGVLEIPLIRLDDFLTQLLLNFVAFEQCYSHYARHMTTYAQFMSCLVRTPKDSTFLSERNIIEKYIGTDEEVASFYRNMAAEVAFDPSKCYLLEQFKEVNKYQRKTRHVHLASWRIKYFDSPWSFLSALAAVILLLMTALQTFYAVYATEKN